MTKHSNSLKEVQNIANSLDLVDGWRILISTLNVSPRGERNRKYCAIHCPLDYFLICSSLTATITNADILKGYKTDHSVITIHVANNNNPSGLGFWKLNILFSVGQRIY